MPRDQTGLVGFPISGIGSGTGSPRPTPPSTATPDWLSEARDPIPEGPDYGAIFARIGAGADVAGQGAVESLGRSVGGDTSDPLFMRNAAMLRSGATAQGANAIGQAEIGKGERERDLEMQRRSNILQAGSLEATFSNIRSNLYLGMERNDIAREQANVSGSVSLINAMTSVPTNAYGGNWPDLYNSILSRVGIGGGGSGDNRIKQWGARNR